MKYIKTPGKITAITATAVISLAIMLLNSCRREEKIFFSVSRDTVTVFGWVKDLDGKPIPKAKVSIYPTQDSAETDETGLYRVSIGLGQLPADAIINIKVEKEGFVSSMGSISFADVLTAPGCTDCDLVQRRIKRLDFAMAKPAKLSILVLDSNEKPIVGAKIKIVPSPEVAQYLGVSPSDFILSVTSQSSPVEITDGIPAIPADVSIVVFPPEGKENDYSVSVKVADLTEGVYDVKIIMEAEPLRVIYTSVDSGQFINPDSDIKVIFSKEVTGIIASLSCNAGPYQLNAKIDKETVTLIPAGRVLGNCILDIQQAFGNNNEVLEGSVFRSFIAFDPSAPRGLACPTPQVNLTQYSGRTTAVSFEAPNSVISYEIDLNFNGFSIFSSPDLHITWVPPVVRGIQTYKIYKLEYEDSLLGNARWEEVFGVTPNFRITQGRWEATVNVVGENISYGNAVSYVVVPFSINGEELCSPENAVPLTFKDNTGPRITGVGGAPGGYPDINNGSVHNVTISFSEGITSGSISITSRSFSIEKIGEAIQANQIFARIFVRPLSPAIPDGTENTDGDRKLRLKIDEATKLWVGEQVRVYNSTGTAQTSPLTITNIAITGTEDALIWFDGNVTDTANNVSNFVGGRIVPIAGNPLQATQASLYPQQNSLVGAVANAFRGLTVKDRIQILDIDGKVRVVEVQEVDDNTNTLKISGSVADLGLKCNIDNPCQFRTLNPDIVFKGDVFDTSGNGIVGWADQTSHNGSIIW